MGYCNKGNNNNNFLKRVFEIETFDLGYHEDQGLEVVNLLKINRDLQNFMRFQCKFKKI